MEDKTYLLRKNSALFNACLDAFSTAPYEVASLNDIIRISGMNKGSFYYHYTDKFDVYLALINAMFIDQKSSVNQTTLNSVQESLTLLFQSLVKLNEIDSRFIRFNRFLFLENDEFYRRVIYSSIGSLYEDIISSIQIKSSLTLFSIRYFYAHFDEIFQNSDISIEHLVSHILNTKTQTDYYKDTLDLVNNIIDLSSTKTFPSEIGFQMKFGDKIAIVEEQPEQEFMNALLSSLTQIQLSNSNDITDLDICHISTRSILTDPLSSKGQPHYEGLIHSKLRELALDGILRKQKKYITYEERVILHLLQILTQSPKIIVINHVLSSLSPFFKEKLLDSLLNYRAVETTIILCESNLEFIHPYCERYFFVKDKRIRHSMHREQISEMLKKEQRLVTYIESGVLMKTKVNSDILQPFLHKAIALGMEIQEIIPIKDNYTQIQSQIQGGIRL